jgi:hypothetical protein
MESDNKQTVFIVDVFSPLNNDKVCFTFCVNNRSYCVKEVELLWGVPELSSVEEESEHPYFQSYHTIDEAREFVRKLKRLEGAKY